MNYPFKILFRSLVKPFYKENIGVFIFLFIVMFCIISKVDGAGVFEYHYSLITGMLQNSKFLLFVFFAWALYARKYVAFVSGTLHKPEYAFIHIFNCLGKARQFRLFVIVEMLLLMPVLLYAIFIIIIGYQQHFYLPLLLVLGYLLLLCIAPAVWHAYLLNNLYKTEMLSWQNLKGSWKIPSSYPIVLIRFIALRQKMIWVGIKCFTCGVLYLITRNNTSVDYDTSFPFLFFNFGILANGIMVYRIREFEETYLSFYRGVPLSLPKRFLQYLFIYFILLIPEFIVTGMLTPAHLQYGDAIRFSLCGYSLLLLMNSITFLQNFSTKEYLKMLLLIFCTQYIFLITVGLTALYLLFFSLAITLFLIGYYRFDRSDRN